MSPMWLKPRAAYCGGIAGARRFVSRYLSSARNSASLTENTQPPGMRAMPWRYAGLTTVSCTTCARKTGGVVVAVVANGRDVGEVIDELDEHPAPTSAMSATTTVPARRIVRP